MYVSICEINMFKPTVLVWKLKKNNAKYRQIDFLSFIFKPEVHSSSKMFVITKWTNQFRFCLGYLGLSCSDEVNYIPQYLHKLLMNFKNLEKYDILKNA